MVPLFRGFFGSSPRLEQAARATKSALAWVLALCQVVVLSQRTLELVRHSLPIFERFAERRLREEPPRVPDVQVGPSHYILNNSTLGLTYPVALYVLGPQAPGLLAFFSWLCKRRRRTNSHRLQDRTSYLTVEQMEAGTPVLIKRGNEWDELLLGARLGEAEWVAYTTDEDGENYGWARVQLTAGNFRVFTGVDADRETPVGIDEEHCNFMMEPPGLEERFAPTAAQVMSLCAEARAIAQVVRAEAPRPDLLIVAGGNADVIPLLGQPGPGAVGPPALPLQGGGPAGSGHQGGPMLGPGGHVGDAAGVDELGALRAAVEALEGEKRDKKGKKDKKKDKDKKKGKDKKREKKKKKRRKGRHSRSSSSGSTSTSSRSSTESSSSSFIRWKEKGTNKRVRPGAFAKLDQEKYKNRAVFLAFCARHPGAMTAHFLNTIRMRMRGAAGMVTSTKQLRDVSLAEWIKESGVTDVRDQREPVTLATIIDHVSRKDLARACDTLVMQVQAIVKAKGKGGSWDKAAKAELIPEVGHAELGPAGLSGLNS